MSAALSPGGMLVVVSGPSGVGKSTVVNALCARDGKVVRSVSLTTRPPRADEADGTHYLFVTGDAFDRARAGGDLLEWAEVHGHRYGTPRGWVDEQRRQGKVVALAIDPQGARAIREADAAAVLVFLAPPSWQTLEVRLRGRGTEDGESLLRRLRGAAAELARARDYDYVVCNDRVETAAETLGAIISAELCRSHRWQPLPIPPTA